MAILRIFLFFDLLVHFIEFLHDLEFIVLSVSYQFMSSFLLDLQIDEKLVG